MPSWPAVDIASGFSYVGETEPLQPEEGETWYHIKPAPEDDEAKVWTGEAWHLMTTTDHSELGGVEAGQHRSDANIRGVVDGADIDIAGDSDSFDGFDAPLPTAALSADAVTKAEIAASAVDSEQLADNAVTEAMLAFSTATQSELDAHAGDETNPHNVTDDQTGAAAALSSHAGDADAHHARYSDSEAETVALQAISDHHAPVSDAHHVPAPLVQADSVQWEESATVVDDTAIEPTGADGWGSTGSKAGTWQVAKAFSADFTGVTHARLYGLIRVGFSQSGDDMGLRYKFAGQTHELFYGPHTTTWQTGTKEVGVWDIGGEQTVTVEFYSDSYAPKTKYNRVYHPITAADVQ